MKCIAGIKIKNENQLTYNNKLCVFFRIQDQFSTVINIIQNELINSWTSFLAYPHIGITLKTMNWDSLKTTWSGEMRINAIFFYNNLN